jgi:hypothetical protein
LSAGFTLEGPADLDLANAWNKDHRSGGVSLGAVRAFLELFRDHSLPDFMAHMALNLDPKALLPYDGGCLALGGVAQVVRAHDS